MKKETQYIHENEILICEERKTPIGKNKRGFFCRKCQKDNSCGGWKNDICTQSTEMDQG